MSSIFHVSTKLEKEFVDRLSNKELVDILVDLYSNKFKEKIKENITIEQVYNTFGQNEIEFRMSLTVLTISDYKELLFYQKLYLDMISNLENKNNH